VSATLKASWPQIRQSIRTRIGETWYNAWLREAHLITLDEDVIELGVAGHWWVDWIEAKYADDIINAVEEVTGNRCKLKLSISGYLWRQMREQQQKVQDELKRGDETPAGKNGSNGSATETAARNGSAKPATTPNNRRDTGRRQIFQLQPRFALKDFVPGEASDFAYKVAMHVVEHPQDERYHPLFIHGPSGVGKTHLLQGVALAMLEQHQDLSVLYVPCEYFLNQYTQAIREKNTVPFREQFRSVDVLLIDDVHQLANKKGTQTEFLHTFNELMDKGRLLILASAVPPKSLEKVSPKLINRFEAGLVCKIDQPTPADRRAIIERRLAGHDKLMRPEIVQYLAERLTGDVREIEGMLNKLIVVSSLLPGVISKETIVEALDELGDFNRRTIMLGEVEDEVVKLLGVTSDEIHSSSRRRDIAFARQVCMYLARNLTDYSLNEIGRYFGNKNHATVVFSEKKIRERMEREANVAEHVETLTNRLKNGS